MKHVVFGMVLCIAVGQACDRVASEPQPAAISQPAPPGLRDSLQRIRNDYDSLRLWSAFDRTQRLRRTLDDYPP